MQLFVQFRYFVKQKKKKKEKKKRITVSVLMQGTRVFCSSNRFFIYFFFFIFGCCFHRFYNMFNVLHVESMHVESFTIFWCLSHSCHRPPMCLPIFSFILLLSRFALTAWLWVTNIVFVRFISFYLQLFVSSSSCPHFWLFNVLNRESGVFFFFSRFSLSFCIEWICDSVDFFFIFLLFLFTDLSFV